MLRTKEWEICSIMSHNKHKGQENVGNCKSGGTAIVIREYLSGYAKDSGADHIGLRR